MHQNYYEAIIQLRPHRVDIEQTIAGAVEIKGIHIAKVKRLKTGVDYYLSSWRAAQQIVKKLLAQYGGTSSTSRKLHTMKDGKKLYRSAIIYRPAPFSPGDVVAVGEKLIKVTSAGKDIRGFNLMSGRKVTAPLKDAEIVTVKTVQVSRNKPHVEVLHPDTYQSIPVENSKDIKKERVRVAEYKGRIYLAE